MNSFRKYFNVGDLNYLSCSFSAVLFQQVCSGKYGHYESIAGHRSRPQDNKLASQGSNENPPTEIMAAQKPNQMLSSVEVKVDGSNKLVDNCTLDQCADIHEKVSSNHTKNLIISEHLSSVSGSKNKAISTNLGDSESVTTSTSYWATYRDILTTPEIVLLLSFQCE